MNKHLTNCFKNALSLVFYFLFFVSSTAAAASKPTPAKTATPSTPVLGALVLSSVLSFVLPFTDHVPEASVTVAEGSEVEGASFDTVRVFKVML